jgi:heat shock protein HslJ
MRLFVIAIILLLTLGACSFVQSQDAHRGPTFLTGNEWSIRGADAVSSATGTFGQLSFKRDGQLTGAGNCFELEGNYEADETDNSIEIMIDNISFRDDCDSEVRETERQVVEKLEAVSTYEYQTPSLTLIGENEVRVFLMPSSLY